MHMIPICIFCAFLYSLKDLEEFQYLPVDKAATTASQTTTHFMFLGFLNTEYIIQKLDVILAKLLEKLSS